MVTPATRETMQLEEADHTEQKKTPGDAQKRRAWTLVWCHAHCHRQNCESQKRSFAKASQNNGVAFVHSKKVWTFTAWIWKQNRSAYVLLTDWRELKPCMGVFQREDSTNQPSLTVVLCADPPSFEKASRFAKSISSHRVHVCRSMEPLQMFFSALAQHIAGVVVELPVGQFS